MIRRLSLVGRFGTTDEIAAGRPLALLGPVDVHDRARARRRRGVPVPVSRRAGCRVHADPGRHHGPRPSPGRAGALGRRRLVARGRGAVRAPLRLLDRARSRRCGLGRWRPDVRRQPADPGVRAHRRRRQRPRAVSGAELRRAHGSVHGPAACGGWVRQRPVRPAGRHAVSSVGDAVGYADHRMPTRSIATRSPGWYASTASRRRSRPRLMPTRSNCMPTTTTSCSGSCPR